MAAVAETGEYVSSGHPLQVCVALAELILQLFDTDRGPDSGNEFGGFERFLEIVVGAAAQAGQHVLHTGAVGEEHDRNMPQIRRGLKLGEYLIAVEPRHFNIEQHDVGRRMVPTLLERLDAVDSLDYLVIFFLKPRADHGANHE
jgi:hypothetical protein